MWKLLFLTGMSSIIAAGCHTTTTTDGQALHAEIAINRQTGVSAPLPDVRLTLRNAGEKRVKVPQWRGSFFGKVIIVCGSKFIELRHKDLWEPLLTGLLVPEMKTLDPGEFVAYDLTVSEEFQSIEDLKKAKIDQLRGNIVSANAATIEVMRACKEYQLYCVVERLEVPSNQITIRQR
jgi:hypothetical protein